MRSYADRRALCRIGLLFLALCLIVQPEVNAKADTHHEAAFSPHGEALHLILRGIAAAEKEILMAAYSFTCKP